MVDYNLANQAGAAFRAELNNIIAALQDFAYGATAPTTTTPGQAWWDTSGANPVLRARNAADTGWVDVGTMNGSTFELAGTTSFTRTLLDDTTATAARSTLGLGSLATQAGTLGMDFIESQDASASSSLDFTGFDSGNYDSYLFEIMNLRPATDGQFLEVLTSSNGGSSYDNISSQYGWVASAAFTDLSTDIDGDGSANAVRITGNTSGMAVDSDSNGGLSGSLRVHGPHIAQYTRLSFNGSYANNTKGHANLVSSGVRFSTAAVDAIRVRYASGNIAAGTISMYGLRNA